MDHDEPKYIVKDLPTIEEMRERLRQATSSELIEHISDAEVEFLYFKMVDPLNDGPNSGEE